MTTHEATSTPSGVARLTPLEASSSLASRAYDHIKAAIIVGDLTPGMLYSVNQFAEALGVSRTPVREALVLLAQQGLLEVERNRGFRLRSVSDKELDEIIQLRIMLEVPAMGQLAALDPLPLETLTTARDICAPLIATADQGDLLEFMRLDRTLHLTLIEALENKRLLELVGNLRDSMYLPGLRNLARDGLLRASADDHLLLVNAIADGNSPEAERVMRDHLERSWHEWHETANLGV